LQNLVEWLGEIGLEQQAPCLLDNDMEFEILSEITDDDIDRQCLEKTKIVT
jgi:hypothetical protein